MTIRQRQEALEQKTLAPWAAKSEEATRENPVTPDDLRTEYQRDRDRILHAKSFRRLKHKTQCFLAPEGDHIRTRLTHTLEVAQIARTLARALQLNEDLTEAIAYGHDLGHTPFGHMGERILNRLIREGFKHREQSLRVVTVIENAGKGLNLTEMVRDGIVHHSGKVPPRTLEGQCVSRADRIAYINHDIDDAIRAQVLFEADLPKDLTAVLGATHGERIDTMIRDVISVSSDGEGVRMSDAIGEATLALRSFLYERVYMRDSVLLEEKKAERMLEALYREVLAHPGLLLPMDYIERGYTDGLERTVCDFIAGMTDQYAMRIFAERFIPGAYADD